MTDRWPVEWSPLADGATLEIGDTSATAVHTPGHAPDHVCLWHADTRALFGGDLAIAGTTVWIPAMLGGDLAAYLASLERVIALNPARILPAHGPVIIEPAALLRGYVEHRRQRERQVIDALRRGDSPSCGDRRARLSGTGRSACAARAEETVIAHLVKLEHDGVARRTIDAWHIIDP